MATAAILGLDTALGAYLARLLTARGYAVRGTGGAALLDRLGIAGDVTVAASPAAAVAGASEVYDLRYGTGVPVAPAARLAVAVDPADTRRRAALAAERAAGNFVATALLYPNESRLGPGSSPVARIVGAAAAGHAVDIADLATSTDCGWTPEYVDALWRLLQCPVAAELVIGTGTVLTGSEAARTAAAFFKRPVPAEVAAGAAGPADTTLAQAALGWRAVTFGRDLVTVLCEGAAAE